MVKKITEVGSSSLVENVGLILGASRAKKKYEEVLACIEPRERFSNCKRAKLIYLVPKWKAGAWSTLLNGNATVLSFEDLPEEIDTEFSLEWPIIRRSLVSG